MLILGEYADHIPTGVFVEEVDRLFDSINSSKSAPKFKELLGLLSNDSAHMDYWDKACEMVRSLVFLKNGKPARSKPFPSQTGWQVSITAIQHVWRKLKKAGFKYVETRNFNQDPLENTAHVFV
jgi:hypothetical protein